MSGLDASIGIDGLVRHTTDMVELTLTTGQRHHRHVEYLSYPDSNFLDDPLETCDDNQCSLEQVYLRRNKAFVHGLSVEVIEINAERIYNPVTEFLYPYLYKIKVRHGNRFEWNIEKRYKHFHDLHKTLVDFVEKQTGRSISSLNKLHSSEKGHPENFEDLPCFPTRNDRVSFINQLTVQQRCKDLQDYLNKVLKHPKFREHLSVREFFEVSPLSFVRGLSKSGKEGALAKRSNDDFRGRSIFFRAPFLCDKCKFHHGQKWFVLKDSYLVYMNPDSALIGFPMLIDKSFSLEQGFRKTGTNNGIRIKNLQRSMIIKFEKEEERNSWFQALFQIKNQSIFIQQHPFSSFAPKRTQQYAQWFINGESYMAAVAKGILEAKEEIFITDWWLSPELLLVRPCQDESMRLDNLLGKRAEEGVRIYVMVFKDIVQVVGLNSWHTKTKLMAKSPLKKNIIVIRHPDHRVMPGTESSFLYSHHEKTLVIDQKIAFIGGIDLCWGRWDTDQHKLIDLSDENIIELEPAKDSDEEEEEENKEAAVKTSEQMAQNNQDLSSKLPQPFDDKITTNQQEKQPLIKSNQQKVTDFQTELTKDERKYLEEEDDEEHQGSHIRHKIKKIFKRDRHMKNDDSTDEDEDIPKEEPADEKPKTIIGENPVVDTKTRFFLGKDYSNSYAKDFELIDKFDEDYIERKLVPRMPWHDEALVVNGQAARDCARHFIQRWNIHKADKFRYNNLYPYILPKSSDDEEIFDLDMLTRIVGEQRKPICVDAQCVRSVSFWSCGTRTIEHSIQNAYLHMIDSAQHFIYIENQFFVTIAQDSTIKNSIGDALYRRIIRANINKENFRVYIVIPLLPGFSNVNAVQAVLYFIMRSINKGETSLYQRLIQSGVTNPEDYITVYGLRNWDILMGKLVTEIIYVHSKLMIVDDRMCICGSANINDRSLHGSRDSEFCLVVNDTEMIESKLNGQTQLVGKFCSSWRKKIFRQILGIKDENDSIIDDPVTNEFYEYFRKTARKNGEIYENVFNTLPTNKIRTFAQIEDYVYRPKLAKTDPFAGHEQCKQIQGFIVEFPLDYLADDVLMPKWNTSEGMAPILLWT